MDRDPVESSPRESIQQTTQLACVPYRVDTSNRGVGKRLEQPPPAGTDREPAHAEVRPDDVENLLAEPDPRPLEVEQELGSGGGGIEELVKLESRSPGGGQLPSIPEDRERPDGLQVPDLEPLAIEADIGFDERGAERLGSPQVGETITRAMGNQERVAPVFGRPERGRRTHSYRV